MPKPSIKHFVRDPELIKEVQNLAKSERHLEIELAREIRLLSAEIKRIKSMEVIKIFRHPWKFLGLSLVKGIMVGFGSVLGATIFLSLFIYILAQISLVPIVGDFVKDVMSQIESSTSTTTNDNAKDQNIFEQYHKAQEDIEQNS